MSSACRTRRRSDTKSSARKAIQKVLPPAGERWLRGSSREDERSRLARPDPTAFALHRTRSASKCPVYPQPAPPLVGGGHQSPVGSAQRELFPAAPLRTVTRPPELGSRGSSFAEKNWQKADWRGQTPQPPKRKPPCGNTVAVV